VQPDATIVAIAASVLLALAGAPPAVATSSNNSAQLHLSARNRQQIELLACRTPHAVAVADITASHRDATASLTSVEVRCQSHDNHVGNPIRFLASCRAESGKWSCKDSGQSIVMAINGREVTAVSQTVAAADMYEVLLKVGTSLVPVAKPGIARGRTASCNIGGDVSDPRVALLNVRCGHWVVDVARLCPAVPCRYETNQRMYLPEPQK
jgi:hypothetical protein